MPVVELPAVMFTSKSVLETQEFGRQFAARCHGGSVIALQGDLGTGKTQFVKGLALGLNYNGDVTSPTFALLHEYEGGRLPIYHFDWYRMEDATEVDRLDIDEYFQGDGVCVVEWADRFRHSIPKIATWLLFRETSPDERQIEVHSPQ